MGLTQMAKLSNRELLWNKISRTVFQDRVIPFTKWIDAVTDINHTEHVKIIAQSLMMLRPNMFIQLLGKDFFISNWPQLRNGINSERKSIIDSVIVLDALWASIATGFAFVKPRSTIDKPLSKGIQSTFKIVSRNTRPVNIYEISKQAQRGYNRVHKDINKLESLGLVNTQPQLIDGRPNRLVSLAT